MESIEPFLHAAQIALKHPQDKARAEKLLQRWATAWQSPERALEFTHSNHGSYLHFNQRIGGVWCKVFCFHASPRHGLSMRGPDTDRLRKSHKHRSNKLDRQGLDALFNAWSNHPEAHPANNAIELFLVETPDETWEQCLKEALECLQESGTK